MAKPRVFVSSTYYDLRHIRAVLESFVRQFGYEPILFEKGSIPFNHEKPLEDSCMAEVDTCDILILIIGGRYGSLGKEDQELLKADPKKFFSLVKSITRKEYEKARDRDIPIFIFVEAGVLSEYRTYQENKSLSSIKYAHVDDKRIYEMLDDVFIQTRNNFVKGFASHDDILEWLREQWAGLFAESLKKRQSDIKLKNLESQISDLASVVASLKSYSEEIVRTINKDESRTIITKVNKEESHQRQLKSFTSERLVDFVKNMLRQDDKENNLTDQQLYQCFLKSDNLKTFLEKVNYPSRMIETFSQASGPLEDFEEMRRKYK